VDVRVMMYQLRRPHVPTNTIEAAKYLALIRKLYPRNRIRMTEVVLTLPTAFTPSLYSSKSLYPYFITTAIFFVSTYPHGRTHPVVLIKPNTLTDSHSLLHHLH